MLTARIDLNLMVSLKYLTGIIDKRTNVSRETPGYTDAKI